MAACIAVVSSTNELLYLRTATCSDPLFYHLKAHAALDVIEDKLTKRSGSAPTHELSDQYLGLLYPIEDHRIYGYVTNTKVKFIIIFESFAPVFGHLSQTSTSQHRDSELRSMFQRLHSAYVDLVCSPFYLPKSPIIPSKCPAAARFESRILPLLSDHASSGQCPIASGMDDKKSNMTDPPQTASIKSS